MALVINTSKTNVVTVYWIPLSATLSVYLG